MSTEYDSERYPTRPTPAISPYDAVGLLAIEFALPTAILFAADCVANRALEAYDCGLCGGRGGAIRLDFRKTSMGAIHSGTARGAKAASDTLYSDWWLLAQDQGHGSFLTVALGDERGDRYLPFALFAKPCGGWDAPIKSLRHSFGRHGFGAISYLYRSADSGDA